MPSREPLPHLTPLTCLSSINVTPIYDVRGWGGQKISQICRQTLHEFRGQGAGETLIKHTILWTSYIWKLPLPTARVHPPRLVPRFNYPSPSGCATALHHETLLDRRGHKRRSFDPRRAETITINARSIIPRRARNLLRAVIPRGPPSSNLS